MSSNIRPADMKRINTPELAQALSEAAGAAGKRRAGDRPRLKTAVDVPPVRCPVRVSLLSGALSPDERRPSLPVSGNEPPVVALPPTPGRAPSARPSRDVPSERRLRRTGSPFAPASSPVPGLSGAPVTGLTA